MNVSRQFYPVSTNRLDVKMSDNDDCLLTQIKGFNKPDKWFPDSKFEARLDGFRDGFHQKSNGN